MELFQMLAEGAHQLGVDLKEGQVTQLLAYQRLLLEWNEKMNLTAITEPAEVVVKHFLDSLSCFTTGKLKAGDTLIDVGTGAGFPGLPLKIALPELKLTLMDALNKRIGFLNQVVTELQLKEVQLIHSRAEDLGQQPDFREKYQIATARAVAPLNVLAEYCLPFVKVNGYFICQKGPQFSEELSQAKKALALLGGELLEVKQVLLPFSEMSHQVLVIGKKKQTPTKYPRKSGKPGKEPIV